MSNEPRDAALSDTIASITDARVALDDALANLSEFEHAIAYVLDARDALDALDAARDAYLDALAALAAVSDAASKEPQP